jgi:phosphoribosyl-ATP pyrophosphohydrolase/phosphoribosyl-AMP cyclohydrolase
MITPATPPSTAGPSTLAVAPSGDAGPPAAKPSYTARLLADRNLRLKKLGEEVAELVLACADQDRARAAEEGADLVYHTLVALRAVGVTLDDVRQVLAARASPTPGR